ncbi:precorrin-6Y C5,15-methyltransferase (decarboxylating) subunit CbiT [Isachenkonia alkalipeptolytica]|nr:precorrin-6Y C5,15-methyltransferase (decarboxylating) subunit CbiT [Isachenkonia alkalipeptolytica]
MKTKQYRGIPDEAFFRGKVPMTKEEVRGISINKLRLRGGETLLDIGAGSGSLSVEMAIAVGKQGGVHAVEINPEGVQLIHKNRDKFAVDNLQVRQGKAPEALKDLPLMDGVVIGGTKGAMKEIFQVLREKLRPEGRLVINVLTLENLSLAQEMLKIHEYKDIEIIQVAINKGHDVGNLTMMKAENSIYILSATKKGESR